MHSFLSVAACGSGGDGNQAKPSVSAAASGSSAGSKCARDVVANSPTSGTLQVKGEAIDWKLVQPIIDNRNAFARYFPCAVYGNDIVYTAPSYESPGDQTPVSQENFKGKRMLKGWVYAQGFLGGDGFDNNNFVKWLLANHAKYPEVKYVNIFYKRYDDTLTFGDVHGWEGEIPSDPSTGLHISYKPTFGGVEYERARSTMMADYAKSIGRA